MNSSEFDLSAAEEVAANLNVSAGMVEKEWHAVRVERLVPPPKATTGCGLPWLHDKAARLTRTLAPLGYDLDASESEDFEKHGSFRRAYRFAAVFEAVEPVRPFVKVDVSIAPCVRPTKGMPLGSRLDRALGQTAGNAVCVCPVETAADKLSALAWRVYDGRAAKEPHTMRHLYDVHALAERIRADQGRFVDLVLGNLSRDVLRIQTGRRSKGLIGRDILKEMFGTLKRSSAFRENYDRFARAFAFGQRPESWL